MKRTYKSTIILLLAVMVIIPQFSGCHRGNVQTSLNQTVRNGMIESSPKIIADYQPWFGTHDHINVGYSTQDPAVLKKQIQKAKDIGIYAFGVDWYGDRRPFEDRSYALLQQIASENNFHVCLMYDETQEDNGQATDDALEAFGKAYKMYIGPNAPGHDAYVRYNGRPVVFIFPKRGHTDWDRVRRAVSSWETPPILIYKDNPPEQYAKDFDGLYAWVHPGKKGWTADGSDWGKEYLEAFYEKMKTKRPDQIVVGGIWPGFDDSKASWGLNRHMDRRCGKTLEDTLAIAKQYEGGPNPMPFLMLATWNDYEEGTTVENGVANCSAREQNQANAAPSP
ncbi:MAG: hypothetical protein JWO91_3174 [Acidobacteriaceae bacterium]|nr:hypothetical protein [Acidobacteriaceae bacterium]